MKKIFPFILISICLFVKFSLKALGGPNYKYQTYTPQQAESTISKFDPDTKVLFIMDYSNSMNERLGAQTKLEQAISTIETLLPKISPDVQMGLRVYGHRAGFTYMDGCTASKLAVPFGANNAQNIIAALYKTRALGWTPITHSLKQAVNTDFAGVTGKKRIILLTDGGENCDESPCTYAISLMRMRDDITIDVIAFDIYDADANDQLKCTAFTTRGKFYTASNKQELENSLSDSLNIDKAVHGKVKVQER